MSRMLMGRALRGAKASSVWEQQACIIQQQRSFSQTPSRQSPKVIFDKTTSPGLGPILEEIQNNIILPYHLPIHQRKRVFSEKLQHRLKSDPVYLEIDGLEHRFSHINKLALPPSRSLTWKAMRAMKTHQDWNNFPRLLSGMRNAGRRYSQFDYIKMIDIAGDKGQIYSIIDAARQTRKTGLRLDDSEKVNTVLYHVQMRAVESGWDKEITQQALRWTEMVIAMLEDPNHAFSHKKRKNWFKVPGRARDPQILAAALHLSAVLAVKHNDGKDIDGKVKKYATNITKLWPASQGLLKLNRKYANEKDRSDFAYLAESRAKYLSCASTILHGLFMASRVVEKPLAEQLRAISKSLASEVRIAVEWQTTYAGRGLRTYNTLFQK
ncbi:hypothetical protein CSHISOI_10686 [Colletotrichum shisoi]|uniref:Uncharacterized protein n=1 Tax=Colletotrichum shisoi TaxID=2078593 RepID=A0A5Q4BCS7_9PEZI|nr:hypothetical protein CSHISOI_10686 [Colletotrichum shisoi]